MNKKRGCEKEIKGKQRKREKGRMGGKKYCVKKGEEEKEQGLKKSTEKNIFKTVKKFH